MLSDTLDVANVQVYVDIQQYKIKKNVQSMRPARQSMANKTTQKNHIKIQIWHFSCAKLSQLVKQSNIDAQRIYAKAQVTSHSTRQNSVEHTKIVPNILYIRLYLVWTNGAVQNNKPIGNNVMWQAMSSVYFVYMRMMFQTEEKIDE